jgi:hypothetical protein
MPESKQKVFGSTRLLRARYLLASIPVILTTLILLMFFSINIEPRIGIAFTLALLGPLVILISWWVARGWFVGMWVTESTFKSKGWIRSVELDRSQIKCFELAWYGGRTLGLLSINPFSFDDALTIVRVWLKDGTHINIESSFAEEAMTTRQVDQLNEWLGLHSES